MRLTDDRIKRVAETIAPAIRRRVAADGILTAESVRAAIEEVLSAEVNIPDMRSHRSLQMVAEEFMEKYS